ncbi:maltokinase N-terminal cap-like domain-containing protein [Propionibacterium sp.]|uniref:maltokinase N-terminal cap-like domain-containing protein n=1 Tax=Propionibacterium sp. TaxID=1977903 RepID=UPI0039ED0A9F
MNAATPMAEMTEDPRWLHASTARWFAGKGRRGIPASITSLDWFGSPAEGEPAVRSEILTVDYPDGTQEYYQLLLSYRTEPYQPAVLGRAAEPRLGWVHDATHDPEALEVVLDALRADGRQGDPGAADKNWSAHLVRSDMLAGSLPARPFSGEQSNSSCFLGHTALVKFFRRLEPGRNIDIEMHEALGRLGVSDVDELYGWADAALPIPAESPGTSRRADLLMLSEQLHVQDEGWPLAIAAAEKGEDFTAQASALGEALARVHTALAQTLPTGELDCDAVAVTMTARLDQAIVQVPALGPCREQIAELFNALRGRRLPAQRVHGDFHLGQTLFTTSGWKIIDLEGEPMKSFAERATLDSVWRDVAGMVRSFGYVAATGNAGSAWAHDCIQAFESGYCGIAMTTPDTDTLTAYVVDKAVYEVVYETSNRPDWVHIPMDALMEIIGSGISARTGRPDNGA